MKIEIEIPAVTFKRVERVCAANQSRRESGDTSDITYDYEVIIDGEHRASLRREIFGRGYRLYDADGRPIPEPGHHAKHLGMDVEQKSHFLSVIREQLHRIPSVWGMAEMRSAEALIEIEVDCETRRQLREQAIKKVAGPVFDALVALRDVATINVEGRCARSALDVDLFAAIGLANVTIAQVGADVPVSPEVWDSWRYSVRSSLNIPESVEPIVRTQTQ